MLEKFQQRLRRGGHVISFVHRKKCSMSTTDFGKKILLVPSSILHHSFYEKVPWNQSSWKLNEDLQQDRSQNLKLGCNDQKVDKSHTSSDPSTYR